MNTRQMFELAVAHYQSGRAGEADRVLREIISREPDHPDALHLAGVLAHQAGRHSEAITLIRRAIDVNPTNAEYHNNIGLILGAENRFNEGIASLQEAIRLSPNFTRAHNNLGSLYADARRWDEAIASFRAALSLEPSYAEAKSNLASALKETGDLDEAIQHYQHAALLKGDPRIASNLVYLLYFHPGYGPADIAEAHREWARAFAAPLAPFIHPHKNDRSPDRKLRIGYVSPDFRQHAVGRFLVPLFDHHDHERFQVYCYSDVQTPDSLTEHLRSRTDVWRDVRGLPDERVAELVRADGIDVLIDLSMHMEGNRLLVFARKPAPVQVTYLAYAGTTGLDTIDYRMSDPYLDPPAETDDAHYSEKTLRLRSYWCYAAPAEAPSVVDLPERSGGNVTFGCLNSFGKVTAAALDTWARILSRAPESRLILHAGEGSHRGRVLDQFSQVNVASDRIEFVTRLSTENYFATYNRIDIALDPFPYPGGTTSCDALWMGVPVVTLRGATAVSRAGVSILSTLGLPELIARSVDQYESAAISLAQDVDRRAELRATLRQRMQTSALLDAQAFTSDFESLLRQAWQTWCANSR